METTTLIKKRLESAARETNLLVEIHNGALRFTLEYSDEANERKRTTLPLTEDQAALLLRAGLS